MGLLSWDSKSGITPVVYYAPGVLYTMSRVTVVCGSCLRVIAAKSGGLYELSPLGSKHTSKHTIYGLSIYSRFFAIYLSLMDYCLGSRCRAKALPRVRTSIICRLVR